jgi:hypothetical protein
LFLILNQLILGSDEVFPFVKCQGYLPGFPRWFPGG